MAFKRNLDYIQAYSLYREGVGGVAGYGDGNVVPHADIDQLRSIGDGRIESIIREQWDNSGHRGKGHEFAGSSEIQTRISEGRISGEVDTHMLGMLLLITMGGCSPSTPSGGTDTRDHAFTPQDPAGSLQLPSTTLSAQHHDDVGYFLYPGVVGESLTLRGGRRQYVTGEFNLRGNGRRTLQAGFSQPSYTAHRLLRDSISTFSFGPVDSPVAYTSQVVSWEITYNNNLQLDHSYYPRGDAGLYETGQPGRGMVAGRMLFGARTITGRLSMLMENDIVRTAEEQNLARELLITSQGDEIESGFNDTLTIRFEDVRFRQARYGNEGDLVAVTWDTEVHMPSTGLWADLLTITLRNGVAEYGLIPA